MTQVLSPLLKSAFNVVSKEACKVSESLSELWERSGEAKRQKRRGSFMEKWNASR
jgi:hypothetical protein